MRGKRLQLLLIGGGIATLVALVAFALLIGGGVILIAGTVAGANSQPRDCGSNPADATPPQDTPPSNATLFAAIKKVAGSYPPLALSMLVGSHLEGGWRNPVSKDGGYGDFQIQQPGVVHPNITIAEAMNPAFATNYMAPTYRGALKAVDPGLWVSNPEQAAEQTVYHAEHPQYDYYSSQGATAVHTAYNDAVAKLKQLGIPLRFGPQLQALASATSNVPTSNQPSPGSCSDPASAGNGGSTYVAKGQAAAVIAFAKTQLGVTYVFGGTTLRTDDHPGALDCSGFVLGVYDHFGVHLPRTSQEQWSATRRYQVGASKVQAGDLVFFVGSGDGGTMSAPGHIGIVLDPVKHLMINAPHTGAQVRIESYDLPGLVGFTNPFGLTA